MDGLADDGGLAVQLGDPGGDTVAAVIIGAVLATLGGFAATQLEGIMRRRERERAAAMLFGEVLSVMEVITTLANQTRGVGDPYGGFTMRMMRMLKRETEVYDRNRESLYDLRDTKTRALIHGLMARLTFTLEGVFDLSDEIERAEAVLLERAVDDPARPEAAAELAKLRDQRALIFDSAVEIVEAVKPVVKVLEPLAKQSFEVYASTVRP
jgi:hypothetical protein